MRYSTEPKYRRYVIGYGFLPFAQKMVINMVKLMDTATKKEWMLQKLPQR